MVRLKGNHAMPRQELGNVISIPYGSIKSAFTPSLRSVYIIFQFLMVRLKA